MRTEQNAGLTGTPAPQSSPPTAKSLLINWANQQDHWIRALVSAAIENRSPIPSEGIETLYDLLLREKGLKDGNAVQIPNLKAPAAEASEGQTLILDRLANLQNVNALAAGQEIKFNPRMTIV